MRGSGRRPRRINTSSRRRCARSKTGRFLVRAANTGISGIVDPYGRVLQATPIYQSAVVVGEARFLTGHTFYSTTGDVATVCFLIGIPFMLIRAPPP